jgi:exosortase E/protease (VPEID-CTERM system)
VRAFKKFNLWRHKVYKRQNEIAGKDTNAIFPPQHWLYCALRFNIGFSRMRPDPLSLARFDASRLLRYRWLILVTLLIGEFVLLSIRFDTQAFAQNESWWIRLANDAPTYLRIALAGLAAFLVIVFPRLHIFAREATVHALAHAWLRWAPLHCLAFGGFYWATRAIFDAAAQGATPSGAALAGWAGLGLGVFVSWSLTFAPWVYWRGLLRREWPAFLAALASGLAAWGLGELTSQFWRPLATATFWLTKQVLELLYPVNILYDSEEHILGTGSFLVAISPQCSGYEGIGLITVFLAIYLWLFRERIRFPQALLLFPLGALAIWLANTLRIALLIAIGDSYSPELALGAFHSQAGWITFALIALGLIVLTERLHLFARMEKETVRDDADKASHLAAEALLLPLLALMAATMIGSALTQGFDWLYPLRPLLAGFALWRYRQVYRAWDWSWSWPALLVGCAVFAAWTLLAPETGGEALGRALNALPPAQRSAWLAFRVFGSAIVVPLAEEMAFRGYLMRRLAAAEFESAPLDKFNWLGFLGSSILFGLVHGRWLAGILAGMAYALAVYRKGKLGDGVVAHMTTNALIAGYALGAEKWSLWA